MEKFPIKPLLLFLSSVLLFIVAIIYVLSQAPSIEHRLLRLNHSYKVIAELEALSVIIAESESVGLEYFLTNNKAYISKYDQSIAAINKQLPLTNTLVAREDIPVSLKRKFNSQSNQQLESMLKMNSLAEINTIPDHDRVAQFKLCRILLEKIKLTIEEIQKEEQKQLVRRDVNPYNEGIFILKILAFATLILLIAGLIYSIFIRKLPVTTT